MPYVVPNQPNPAAELQKELVKDALLAALTHGMSLAFAGGIPNPNFGQTGSQSTLTGLGGNPASGLAPQNPQAIQAGFTNPTPPAPYANRPMLNATQFGNLQNLQNYQKANQDIAMEKAQANWYNRLPGMSGTVNPMTGQPQTTTAGSSIYQVGDILERNGKRSKITGFDTDGMPIMEPF